MNETKVYNLLGLTQKAGKLVSGENTLISKGNFNKYSLLIIAQDSSEATKKKFINKAINNNIDYILFGTKNELGMSLGKSPRTVLAISDFKLAQKIKELIGGEDL